MGVSKKGLGGGDRPPRVGSTLRRRAVFSLPTGRSRILVALVTAGVVGCAAPRPAAPPDTGGRLGSPEPAAADLELAVTGVEPATGSFLGGLPVTVRGRNFPRGATVSIGGVDIQGELRDPGTIV